MTNTKENRWDLFKKGATDPITLSMSSMIFIFFIALGAAVASYNFLVSNSPGLFIMFLALALLQLIGLIKEYKNYKFLKSQESTIRDNEKKFDALFKKIKKSGKVI